jgi:hypothetical protein
MSRNILLLLLCCILGACGSNDAVSDCGSIVLGVSFKNREVCKYFKMSNAISKVEYVPLNYINDSHPIGNITDIRIENNHIYILNQQEKKIMQFNSSGDFVAEYSHYGRGNGEYITLTAFDINPHNGEVSILDLASRKILVYSSSNDFLRSFSVDGVPRDFAVLNNGEYVFYTPDYMPGVRYGIWKSDSSGQSIKDLMTIPSSFKYSGGLKEKYFHHFADTVYVVGSECFDDIYHITSDSFLPQYHLNVDLTIPKGARKTALPVLDRYIGKVYTTTMCFETKDWLILQVFDMKNPIVVLYDKKVQEVYYTDASYIEDDMPYGGVYVSSTDSAILGVIYPEQVLSYSHLKEQFPNITIDSNPIIAISYTK